jgi:undecaprenyl-diphosphatase
MESLDQSLFIFINSTLSHPFLDWFLPAITDLHKNKLFPMVFIPLLLIFWVYKKRWAALPAIVGTVICIASIDNMTYRVLKPLFERERPPAVEKVIVLRTDRYAGYSFPSNHAANNFGMATFVSYCYPALSIPLYVIASLVSFSRVYVGVHYPLDIVGGALFGVIFGLFFFKIWVIIWKRAEARWPALQSPRDSTAAGETNESRGRKN